jgi:hypothetical protein
MTGVETVVHDGVMLAIIIHRDASPAQTTFVTAGDATLQLGFIVYGAGGTIARHVHRPVQRRVVGTPEALVVRRGRCELDVYTPEPGKEKIATRELGAGDVVLLLAGGHGFRVLEDTVLLEIKQGPFVPDDKARF